MISISSSKRGYESRGRKEVKRARSILHMIVFHLDKDFFAMKKKHTHTQTRTYTHKHAHTHTDIHKHIRTYTHTHTHTHTQIFQFGSVHA